MSEKSILFMGRKKDPYSAKILAHLKGVSSQVTAVYADGFGSKLPADITDWQGDIILCFRSHFILDEKLIAQASIAAINIHPGPPAYRGTGCVNWALYEEAKSYGTTAHLMAQKIDSGTILDVRRFPVTLSDTLQSILKKTYENATEQAKNIIDVVTEEGSNGVRRLTQLSSQECWVGKVRSMRELDALYHIPSDADEDETARIIRATKVGKWAPYKLEQGKKLYL
ncbi:MAG: hypothetical protein KUG56_01870 [Kordiimonadaceae bacterium]|nr:hypothetical protein [Kordiimonadaceae bacterium]